MLFLRRSKRSPLLLTSALLLSLIGLASTAVAASVSAPASSTFGYPLEGSITIDDGIDPGNLVVTLNLDTARGDVRGFLAHVADESLLDGLSIVDARKRSTAFDANEVGKAKKSQGLGRPGSACPCDLGIRFSAKTGTTVSFTLTHETEDLSIALFYGQDFAIQASGIRIQDGVNRRGQPRYRGVKHSLLEGRVPNPIPEPTTAMLMALGLVGLSYAGRPKRV